MIGLADQPPPVVVTDLVTEMADDGTERLAQAAAQLIPVLVVGLREIKGHDPSRCPVMPPSPGRCTRSKANPSGDDVERISIGSASSSS